MTDYISLLVRSTLIIGGWVIVHTLAVRRDRDKGRRDAIGRSVDQAIGEVDRIFEMARDYHLEIRRQESEVKIKMALSDLSIRLTDLDAICASRATAGRAISSAAKLRRAITGKHFEDENSTPLLDDDQQLDEIAAITMEAKRNLVALRNAQFRM